MEIVQALPPRRLTAQANWMAALNEPKRSVLSRADEMRVYDPRH